MKKFSSICILIFFIISWSQAQDLDSEVGFKYVKADYLIKTQRFDEAVKELNEIITNNPGYNNALFLRAELRFRVADYINAKGDGLKVIELKGINHEVAALIGRCDYALGNKESAELSLDAAIKLGSNDEKVLLEYADLVFIKGNTSKACEIWQKAARNGSSTATINITKNCGKSNTNTEVAVTEIPNQSQPIQNSVDSVRVSESGNGSVADTSASQNQEEIAEEDTTPVFTFPVPEEDNTMNEIVIDEDLTISLYGQGIGKRKILEKPSILILSEVDGEVAIEICINENGRVETAEFVSSKSSIDNKGLVSLAVRKSRDFWFEKSEFRKQCGYIIYKVKGS
jgi:tetratricopeptide (TPR) repeat protein